MKKLIAIVAVILAAIFSSTASAHWVGHAPTKNVSYSFVMNQYEHGKQTVAWLKKHPRAGTKTSREKVYENHVWLEGWAMGRMDQSIWPSVKLASDIFSVSSGLMESIVNGEGGNVNPSKLKKSLCSTEGIGWNTTGHSAAFGPMQYMLSYRGACFNSDAWGTFGAYDDRAFSAAKTEHGVMIPERFRTPASNLGQSIVTAYIISRGEVCVHWSASLTSC